MAEPTLQRGRGPRDWVVYAQQMLNEALSGGMHIDVPENGVFDEEFEGEVEGFQARVGIEVDGKIGPDTWDALKAAVERKHAATAEEEDEPDAPPEVRREREKLPSQHRDDNVFRETQDADGNTVRVYDMEGEELVHQEGEASWNDVVNIMVEKAETRNMQQVPFVMKAVGKFKESSEDKIGVFVQQATALEENTHVEFPWGLLIDGLDTALGEVFTVENPAAAWVYGHIKSALIENIVGDLTQRASAVPGLAAQLRAGVAALAQEVDTRESAAIETVQRDIRDFIHTAMLENTEKGTFTNEGGWIETMVTWYGFPQRTEGTVTEPILRNLNQQFDAMLYAAQEQMLSSL